MFEIWWVTKEYNGSWKNQDKINMNLLFMRLNLTLIYWVQESINMCGENLIKIMCIVDI